MDEVVDFAKFRDGKKHTVQVHDPVFTIPQLYRIGGFEFDTSSTADVVLRTPSNRPIVPQYTLLSKMQYPDIARQTMKPIDCLDPAIDAGWVIVRQHADASDALTYIRALRDTFDGAKRGIVKTMKSPDLDGVFSVMHRPASKDCLDHLLIYVSEYPGAEFLSMEERFEAPERYAIYHPDGTVTHDPSIFYGL